MTNAHRHLACVARVDLQVLGRVCVDHTNAGVEIINDDDGALLATQCFRDPLTVLGAGHLRGHLCRHRIGELHARGDQYCSGDDVVLGLADEIGGDVAGIGGIVSQHSHLGGTSLGVDADDPLQLTFGRRDVDIARTRDEIDRSAAGAIRQVHAVGQHRDRLRATDRVDLVDSQEGARREDRGVRPAAEIHLGWGHDSERLDPRDLGRNHVHDHAARIDRAATGNVEAHPLDRDPPLRDGAPWHHGGGHIGAALIEVHHARPGNGFQERRAHIGVQCLLGNGELLHGDPERRGADMVELLAPLEDRLRATRANVVEDRADAR